MLHYVQNMYNAIIGKSYPTVQEMWNRLNIVHTGTFTTNLCAMAISFKTYLMDSKHIMAEHPRVMGVIICGLKAVGNNLSDVQHILAIIQLLDS